MEVGDILISHINSEPQLGNCCLYKGELSTLIHGMNLLRIKPDRNFIFSEFLYFTFLEYKLKGIFISIASRAVNQASINQQKFKNLPIPLPPLEEQKAIAEVLRAIQDAKEKTEAVIKATKELRKSMMKQLFTYGVYKDESREWKIGDQGTVELKETEIGLIPRHWQVVKLGDVYEIIQGKTPKKDEYSNYPGHRIIKVKDFEDGGFVNNAPLGERSFVINDLGERYRLKYGDILILSAGHSSEVVGQKIGGVFYLETKEPTFFVAELIRVRAKEDQSNTYFCFGFLNLNTTKKKIREEVKGGHLYPRDMKDILIPLPPLEEQKAIADILLTIDEKIQKEEAKKKSY